MWTEVTPSEFPHERQGLDYVKARLPEAEPHRAWSNFTFTDSRGGLNEVDLLVVTPARMVLVELKGYPGEIEGDAGQWAWTGPKHTRPKLLDNPLHLADRKAKKLKSLLESTRAAKGFKGRLPYMESAVFLHAENLTCRLTPDGRHHVFGLDENPSLDGIMRHLTALDPRYGRQIDRPTSAVVAKAMEQAGIRRSAQSRKVGHFTLGELLDEAEDWQDFKAAHPHLPNTFQRIRLYPFTKATSDDERAAFITSAKREVTLLQGVDHPAIERPSDLISAQAGPAVVFPYDADAARLDHWLTEHADSLGLAERLDLVRLLAEGLRSAHSSGLYHRALSPRSIVVSGTPDRPKLKIRDWQTAARLHSATGTATGTHTTGHNHTGTRHVGDHVNTDDHVYLAPEVLILPDADPRTADIFSLGAIAILILTGQPPAADLKAKQAQLRDPGHLTLAAVADPGLAAVLDDELFPYATAGEAGMRLVTVAEFLDYLSYAEELLTAKDTVDPLNAKPGDVLDDTWTVVKRFGAGSTAVVLLVQTADGTQEVLKVARDDDANSRLADEFEVATAIRNRSRIIDVHDLTEVGGRTVLRMEAADRTLARELADAGTPGLDLLQRWGTDLLEAVAALEEDGLAHRDIKPDNAGLAKRGNNSELHLVLFDFSLARANPEDLRAGTPGYVDPFLPERDAKRWDAHAERYAAAITLHEMATGVRPAWGDGTTDPALLPDDVVVPILTLEVADEAVRQPLSDFFTTALHRQASARFDTAADMLTAWQRVFAALDAPATDADQTSLRPGLPAAEVDLSAVTETTTIRELGLSPRVTSALDRQGVETVTDLAVIPLAELTRMSSVGSAVRKEIVKLAKRLSARLDAAATPASALTDARHDADDATRATSIDRVLDAVLPSARTDADVQTVIRELLGLTDTPNDVEEEGETPPQADEWMWPSQAVVAERTGLDRAAVAAALVSTRTRWVKRVPELTAVRTTLVEALESRGGIASGQELAAALLTLRGSTAEDPVRSVRARAVVRAALEAEQQLEGPRMRFRRAGEGLLVALDDTSSAEGPGGDTADADTRFAYAELLGEIADDLLTPWLARTDDTDLPSLPTREQCVRELREIEVEEGMAPLTDARLVRLAAVASATAAVSSRLELYPRDLPAVDAVRLLRPSLQVRSGLTPAALRSRVAARFPDIQPLPDRPQLDMMLSQADAGLTWVITERGEGRYCPSGNSATGTATSYRTSTSYASVDDRDAATEVFDQRIDRLVREGGFVTVTVKDRALDDAIRRLTTATKGTHVRLDGMLLAAMRQLAAEAGADWSAFEKADGDRTSRGWRILTRVAEQAAGQVETTLLATDGIVVADGIGLLGRYEQMGLIDRLRERLTREDGDHKLLGLALVVPGADPTAKPMVDGVPVPVITPAHWTHLPTAWLNDRTGAAA